MKQAFIIFLFFSSCFHLQAQILNIENLRMKKDTARTFMVKTTAGLNMFNRSAGVDDPVNLFGYNLDVNALYYPNEHAYVLVSKLDYLRINENDFLNFGFAHMRMNLFRDKKVNYEIFTQYSFDNFRGLDPRLLAGGSFRINLIDNQKTRLILGLGGFYEWETWRHPYEEQIVEIDLVKSSNYLSFRATLNEYVDINTVNYYQVGYDPMISDFRHRISSSTVLNTKISDWLSFTNTFEINYENRPVVPITNLIFSFRTGLSFDF
ncbi:DUF481 domain-containing protein [Pleomorphovibrio marinus]|uniref:DUF481 domain-containing protein n=1 Tax=Pleomorphovibrio marinus TaxID=2164132 RepID=UPI000E0C8BE3|nr:DUF481 domain-containing protein [Pleomorphovibrio marinus]